MSRGGIYLDQLLGRKVFDIEGRPAGRIEEVIARNKNGEYFVEAFLLGRVGLFERLSIAHFAEKLLRGLGATGHPASHSATWDQMDLSDLRRPRLHCPLSALKPIR